LVLLALLKDPTYPTVTLMELLFLDLLREPALVSLSKNNEKVYDYFEDRGFPSDEDNLQSLSYNFCRFCCDLCLLLAYLKPHCLYRKKEYACASKAARFEMKLIEKGLDGGVAKKAAGKHDFLFLKKLFVRSLIEFNQNPHAYVELLMGEMELFLTTNAKSTYFLWFRLLCREGDVYLSSEALARLAEILCFHRHFAIRKNALELISELVFWGDLEALLLLNYTNYFETIASGLLEAQRRKSTTGVFCLFPELEGQTREKEGFVNDFLLCLRRVGTVFPSLDSYFLNSGQTPICQLYMRLLKSEVAFPPWPDQEQFEEEMLNNFRKKKGHNEVFLEELGKHKEDVSAGLNSLHPTFSHLAAFCARSCRNFDHFLCHKEINSREWDELADFRKHFELYVERMIGPASDTDL
jgi:hypothetical protein